MPKRGAKGSTNEGKYDAYSITEGSLGVRGCTGEHRAGGQTCHAGEGWVIENGQLGEHLRDVSFSGMTLETLRNIDAVSKDLEFLLPGRCGKSGQGMHINAGGPYVRVKEVVVGGQE